MADFETRPNYKIIQKLGKGAFGSVYKIIDTKDNKIYALKKIELNSELEKTISLVENESNILSSINNQNIVKYYGCFREKDSFYILMEFCEYNDLNYFIQKYKQKNELIPEPLIRTIIREICYGIKEIHSKKVIHRDLKPENIFISDDYKIKIGDFGISKILDGTSYAQTFAGTSCYMAPEIIRGVKYTNKIDIWSIGCILYELCSLKRCFDANNFLNLAKKIVSGNHGKIDLNYYNENIQNIIDLLLKINEKERPNIDEANNLITKKISLNEFKKFTIPDNFGFKIQIGEKEIVNQGNNGDGSRATWGDYINYMLLNKIKGEHIYHNILIEAALIGFDATFWAATKGLVIKKEEVDNLKQLLVNKPNSTTSLTINNKNYQITNYNKGFTISFKSDNIGGTIAKTNLTLIIGIYDQNKYYKIDNEEKNQNSNLCKMVVEELAKALIDMNY